MDELTKPNLPSEDEGQTYPLQEGGDPEQSATPPDVDVVATIAETVMTPAQEVPKEKKTESKKSTVSLEELDAAENEYSAQEMEQMLKFYEETLADFVSGEVVTGKVLAINDKEVAVDIGFKSEGTVPIDEFGDVSEIKVGDNIQVFIDDIEDADGMLILSKKKADFMRVWDMVNKSYESGEIVQGKCMRRIKGGIVVDLTGVDAFLPGSQIDVRPIRDFDALIGQTMDFKIVKINNMRKNIVVSHRVLVEEEMKGQREKILEDLQKGQILEGTVKNITDFGVFIDLGGVDGLLHINDLSWGRVAHPSEVVALDEKIKVVVLDFNDDKDRISLGLKQLQPHPWENVESKYPVTSVVRGKVVSISDYGAFVELEKGVEGLIHISEMSWTQHIKHPSKVLAVGEMVDAKVLSIMKDERKISLGLKQLEPDPWQTLAERYPVGTRHTGKVRNLTNFGAFVELEDGIDGLIHISDLSWTKKIRHPGEVVKKGDEIEVIVLNVDRDNRRISLGYKQTQDNPWDFFEDKYTPGAITGGKVVRLIEKGLIVELPESVDGFVPMSQLAKENLSKPADGYQIDDELTLSVIEFNKENKKIVLSEKNALKAEARDAKAELKPAETAIETEEVMAAAAAVEAPPQEPPAESEPAIPLEAAEPTGAEEAAAAEPVAEPEEAVAAEPVAEPEEAVAAEPVAEPEETVEEEKVKKTRKKKSEE